MQAVIRFRKNIRLKFLISRKASHTHWAALFWAFLMMGLARPSIAQDPTQQFWKATKTEVRFFIKNAGMEVEGHFDQVSGTFVTRLADQQPVLIMGVVQVKSIDTGVKLRDAHLQTASYFNASKFPEMRMQLIGIDAQRAKFNVLIRGVNRVYEMPYEWRHSPEGGQFTATFKLNRRDFKVGGNSLMLDEEVSVRIALDLQPTKP